MMEARAKIFILSLALAISPHFGAIAQPSKDNPKEAAAFKALLTSKAPKQPTLINLYDAGANKRFTLDRSLKNIVLLKFENGFEVWALSPISGPRGDEFLRNDIGETMVRITSYGGVTLYTKKEIGGIPASSKGKAQAIIKLEQSYIGNMRRVIDEIPEKFAQIQLPTPKIEIKEDLPPALVNDAILRIIDALAKAPNAGKSNIKIKLIRFNRAPNCFVVLNKGILDIGLTPGISYAGRPSSFAISKALGY